jgi:regulator of replication initiation timing
MRDAAFVKACELVVEFRKQVGALEAERDEMKEEIKQANKEASDATARQTEARARALNYSLQAEEARREIERLREADAKIIEGLRADVEDLVKERDALRAEVADLRGTFDMVHASLGIKRGDHIGKAIEALKAHTPKRSHPVAVGGYLRRLSGFNTTPAGEVARVLYVDCDGPATEYTVKRPNGQQGVWSESGCEPCGPPADHDTPAGKQTAQAAVTPLSCVEIVKGADK